MSIRPLSFRRRNVVDRSLRQSQPVPWSATLGGTHLSAFTNGITVTASSTANTAGSWAQIFSSTAISSSDTIQALSIVAVGTATQQSGADNSMLLDIGTGASGSEVVVVPDLAIGGLQNSTLAGPLFTIPVRIAGATRIAFRVRAAVGSRSMFVSLVVASGSPTVAPFAARLPTSLDTLGSSQSTSTGTAMSGSANTWTVITSATTKDYQALVLIPSTPASETGLTATVFTLELGIGPSGSEVPVAFVRGTYGSTGGLSVVASNHLTNLCGRFIPAGTRIAVRHNLANNPQRVCACVIGVPYV